MSDYRQYLSLTGKNAVVCGGAGLIGAEITTALAQNGARVIVVDSDRLKGAEIAAKLSAEKLKAEYVYLDLTKLDKLENEIKALAASLGQLDIWVNSSYPRTKDWGLKLEDVSVDSFCQNIDMQLNSFCLSAKIAAMQMKAKGGSIILLGSIYGLVGPDFNIYQGSDKTMPFAYAVIKGGLANVTRYLASYFGKDNIRVNSVCPGGVWDNQEPKFLENYAKRAPLGRMVTAQEVASAVLFLATPAATGITGINLAVDAGWTAI